jgi:hypothetical protein
MASVSTGKQFQQQDHPVATREPDVVFCSVADGGALLNLARGVYFGLDAVGTRIWELLQVPRSTSELVDALVKEYDISAERCRNSVNRFLDQLSANGLVQYEAHVTHK